MPDIFEFAKDDTERRINSRVHWRERHGKVEVFKDGELYAVFGANDREFRKATMIQLARLGAASLRELCAGFRNSFQILNMAAASACSIWSA